jgi:hypothetical protein
MRLRAVTLSLLLAACASGQTSATPDAARLDARGPDAASAMPDARAPDAAPADATPADAIRRDGAGGSPSDATAAVADGGTSFAAIEAIFAAHCTNCHDAGKLGLPSYPQLPLTTGVAFAVLVGQPAHETCGGQLVVPGHPERSYLYLKLTQPTPCEGARMPRPFEVLPVPALPAAELALIRAWITAGANP